MTLDQLPTKLRDAFQEWMKLKSLKLDPPRTELLLTTSKPISKKIACPVIFICDTEPEVSEAARMIGVLLDKHSTMQQHISSRQGSALPSVQH